MPRKGEMSDVDKYEQAIIQNAEKFVVVSFRPGTSSKNRMAFENLDYAVEYGRQLLNDEVRIRAVMVYAIDEDDHHALVGTINRHDMLWKEVKPKIY